MHDQYRVQVKAAQDQHDEQLQAIEENGRLCLTKFNQIQEDLRHRELLNHNKKVKALEKKNMELETIHGKMMDRVVDSHDNQLRYQKFEMGEQERKFQQEMELKETEVKTLRDIGIKLKVEHDAKVHKLEEDNKVLKSQVERFKVNSKLKQN